MKKLLPLCALLAACHQGAMRTSTALEGASGTVREITIPAAQLTGLSIRGRDGTLVVRSADVTDAVVSVTLHGNCDARFQLTSRHDHDGTTLEVSPSSKDNCREAWTVQMPSSANFTGKFDDADARIVGLKGTVSLDVGHGTVTLDQVDGAIRAHVINGNIVASRTVSWDVLRVASQVGRVAVSVRGRSVSHVREAGAGDWMELPGSGSHRVDLKTQVGDVSLRLDDQH